MMIDPLGRRITYLRLSVTDRCDLRCHYCMSERMSFLPKADLLTFEELDRLCTVFIAKGVKKIRLTGGEPLVRKGILTFIEHLARHLRAGALDELTLTSNGTQLPKFAKQLKAAGVERINVSLDTLDAKTYGRITRRGDLADALAGIDAALDAGLAVKINTVALKHDNLSAIPQMIEWAHDKGMDISLIEVMPLGEIDGDRLDQFASLKDLRAELESKWTLHDLAFRTGGPARYAKINETGGRIGFISPLTNNFCDGCNRVRMTCTGRLYLCLGQDDHADMRTMMRAGASDDDISDAISAALTRKPKAHNFNISQRGQAPALSRHMSVTGG